MGWKLDLHEGRGGGRRREKGKGDESDKENTEEILNIEGRREQRKGTKETKRKVSVHS